MKSQNSRCSLQGHTAKSIHLPSQGLLLHHPPEEIGYLWFHCLCNAVRSWYRYAHTKEGCRVLVHYQTTPQIPFTIFVSRKYICEGRAQKTRAILAETGAGGETEVRLWSQQKSGCVFGEYSMALGQCLSDSVSMRSAVTSENCTFEHMPWGKQCSWITLPQFHQEQTKPITAMSLWGMFYDLDCIWVIRDFKGPLSKSIKALQNMTGTGIQ